MFNRRGDPIRVHLIQRHVEIPREGVAQRVVQGPMVATAFTSMEVMERAVTDCLADRGTEISEILNSGEGQAVVMYRSSGVVGFGYRVRIRQSQANKRERGHARVPDEITSSELVGVTVVVRVSDARRRLYRVETAYPTPEEQ